MLAPEPSDNACRYFVDYEIWAGGQAIAWGQLVQASAAPCHGLEDDALLHAIRQRAAQRHGVAPVEVRVRILSRL